MNNQEQQYLQLLQNILSNGEDKKDRTNTGTRSIFGTNLRFSLDKFPLLTTKKMFLKGIIEELLFFLRGDTNTKTLEAKGVNIWKGNTSREYLDKIGLLHEPEGSLGKGYGYQWRHWGKTEKFDGFDQILSLVTKLKSSPDDRRMLVSAWNVSDLLDMALPPCHYSFQCYVSSDKKLSLLWNQRSVDSFLGLPYNIASYAILNMLLAKLAGLTPGEIIFNGGDTHIYQNHFDQVTEQISRQPFEFPELIIPEISSLNDINDLSFEDFKLNNYNCHSSIKAEMAV
jgi:thymidylate synthase